MTEADAPSAEPSTPATGRHARRPWQIPAGGWWQVIKRTAAEGSRDNLDLLAAGVAFYWFLALVPLLAAIVLAYGLIADPATVSRHILALVQTLPRDIASVLAGQLVGVTTAATAKKGLGLLVALGIALFGAMRGARSLMASLNVVYEEDETRGFVRRNLVALGITAMLVGVGLAVAVATGLSGGAASRVVAVPFLGRILGWLFAAAVIAGVVAALFRFAPDRAPAKWSWLTPGATLTSVGVFVGTLAFGLYVARFADYGATYGALGAVVSFLMWLWVTALIVLYGAEFNAELERQTAEDTTTGAERPMGARGAEMADTVA